MGDKSVEHKSGLIIFPSFFEALDTLEDDDRHEIYDKTFRWFFKGESPTFSKPTLQTILTLMKPNIENTKNRYMASVENGKKGGAPKGNQNAKKERDKDGI